MWQDYINILKDVYFDPWNTSDTFIRCISIVIMLFVFSKSVRSFLIAFAHSLMLFAINFALVFVFFFLYKWLSFLDFLHFGMVVVFWISSFLTFIVYEIFFYRHSTRAKALLACFYIAIYFCHDGIVANIVDYLSVQYHVNSATDVGVNVMRHSLFAVLSLGTAVYLQFFNIKKIKEIPISAIVVAVAYMTVSVALSWTQIVLSVDKTPHSVILDMAIFSSLFLIGILVYFMLYNICTNFRYKQESAIVERQVVYYNEMMALSRKNIEDTRKYSHDMKNHFLYMRTLLQDKKYKELKQYFDQYCDGFESITPIVNTGNNVIDNVLNIENQRANKVGAKLDIQVCVPNTLGVNETDLCCLLMNLLDNAVEACAKVEANKRNVSINIYVKQEFLFIFIGNPAGENIPDGTVGIRESTKDDKNSHGYGMKIVSDIIEKYNGMIKYKVADGQFNAEAMLSLQSTEVTENA